MVGFQNYIDTFTNSKFWHSVGITLKYAFIATGVEIVFGMCIVLLLNHESALSRFLRLVLVFPLMIAPVIGPKSPSIFTWRLLDLKPAVLSSGQKQRVNIARALIRRPAVLLLDEPLSHLDTALRVKMRTVIKRLHTEQRFTTIVVTHVQLDAMALADRIAVLNDGKLQQFDTPLQVFNHPANEFVAGFVGEPPMNIFAVNADSNRRLVIPNTDFALPITDYIQRLLGNRTSVRLGVRPWGIHVSPTPAKGSVPATVSVVENLGDETRVGVRYGDMLLMASTDMTRAYKPGSKVNLISRTRISIFSIRTQETAHSMTESPQNQGTMPT